MMRTSAFNYASRNKDAQIIHHAWSRLSAPGSLARVNELRGTALEFFTAFNLILFIFDVRMNYIYKEKHPLKTYKLPYSYRT